MSRFHFIAVPLLASCLAASLLTGCNFNFRFRGIQGNGVQATQQRDVRDFDSVDVGSAFQVDITTGGDYACEVTIDENLMDLIETSVADQRLVIKSTGSYSASSGGLIKIVMPAIKALNGSGATNTTIKNLKTDHFSAELSGASKLAFEVTEPLSASESEAAVDQLQVKVSGASKFDGALLPTNHVKAQASGASRIILQVQQSIEAETSGASAIVYRGDAKLTSQKTSGASKIAHE